MGSEYLSCMCCGFYHCSMVYVGRKNLIHGPKSLDQGHCHVIACVIEIQALFAVLKLNQSHHKMNREDLVCIILIHCKPLTDIVKFKDICYDIVSKPDTVTKKQEESHLPSKFVTSIAVGTDASVNILDI